MVEAEAMIGDQGPAEQLLDPFSFHVGVESRILGLGGNAPGYDHGYAFHTPYVEAAPGRATFTLRFRGLRARRGTLELWVNMLPTEPGAHARVANSQRVQLNRIVQADGLHVIPFESFTGVSFALHGRIADETDAEAEALVVALDRPADPEEVRVAVVEAKSSSYGRAHTRPATHLIALGTATLAHPVSQCATAAQLREPTAAAVVRRSGPSAASPLEQWQAAYVMQALACYGMLEAGARGLAIEHRPGPLAALVRDRGVEVTLATTGEDGPADALPVDPAALPRALINYDLLWSIGTTERLGSIKAAIDFADAAVACLRPGGMAVLILPFAPYVAWRRPFDPPALFTRNEVERLALTMIAHRHEIAQVRIDVRDALVEGQGEEAVGAFGVIVRRPPSVY